MFGIPVDSNTLFAKPIEFDKTDLSHHDRLALIVGGTYSRLQHLLTCTSLKNLTHISDLVTQACKDAHVPLETIAIPPIDVANILRTNMAISLLLKHPDAWDYMQTPDTEWFEHARTLLETAGYKLDYTSRTLYNPAGNIVTSTNTSVISQALKIHRKAANAAAIQAGKISPSENAFSQLLTACGPRPGLDDHTLRLVSSLIAQHDDTQDLQTAAGNSHTCPACKKRLNAHHPMRCTAIAGRGLAHDAITNSLTRQLATNDTLTPTANKQLWHLRDTKDFRPDIEVAGILVEVKTLNYDTHGPRLRADQQKTSIAAKKKYMQEVGRVPLIVSASTNGHVTPESHATLKELDKIRDNGMPLAGTRLLLYVGHALALAAAEYYAQWHQVVANLTKYHNTPTGTETRPPDEAPPYTDNA